MKFRNGIVLAHHPGSGKAELVHAARGERDDLRVPAANRRLQRRIAAQDAVGNLGEGVLDLARVLAVSEALLNLRVRERPAEPGRLPE